MTTTWHTWYNMIWRCKQTSGHFYQYYGARGIKVCDRWLDYENFLEDMGERPEGATLDRIDNDKGYSPDNCKWATRSEQQANTRKVIKIEVDGISLTYAEWAKKLGRDRTTVRRWHTHSGIKHFEKRVRELL